MHILHVVRQYAPGIGGLENYVAMLAKCQQQMGHEVRVLTLDRIFDGDGGQLPVRELVDGVPVERIGWRGSSRYPLAPGVLRHLGDADLIHVHGVDFFIDALAATRMVHRKPIILSTHGGFFHTGFAQRAKRIFFATVTRWSLLGVRAVLASSIQDRDTFAKLWPDRTFLVENAVDVEKFRGLAQAGARTIIYFGRIAPNKEVPQLLRWFPALHAAEPDWRLIVAGKPMGVSLAALGEEAGRLGLGDVVEFHDTPDDATLKRLIARSGVYACASSYEGFGLAAVEAVSAGLYPLLSDIPPFRRTLDRIGYGTLIDFGADADPRSFLADWRRFAAERPAPDAIAARVAPFAWGRVAEQIERIMTMVLGRDVRRIGCVDVAVTTGKDAMARVLDAVEARQPLLVAFANAHTINIAQRDRALAAALRGALVLNDGIGVEIASRSLYGAPFPENLNGTDFTPALLAALRRPTRIFLVGSAPGIAEQAARRLEAGNPHVKVAGTQHGFFGRSEEEALAERILASGAELVLAAMGNPRQELWAHANLARLGVPILCVGALLDFTAGVVRRAPAWVQRTRTEWVYRLAQEPRRMVRRYLIGNAVFLGNVARQWTAGRRGAAEVDMVPDVRAKDAARPE